MSATPVSRASRRGRTLAPRPALLRGFVVLGLAVDAFVHFRLADGYQRASAGGIGTGTLCWLEAIASTLAGLWVLLRGSRAAYATAAIVALSAAVAVVLYRYVNVPAFGPFPSMYEPVWYFDNTLSAVAETVGGLAAARALLMRSGPSRTAKN